MDLEQVNSKQADFKRLLLKTPLEPFTSQLWEAFQGVACNAFNVSNIIDEIETKARSHLDYATNVAQSLLAILNNEPVKAGKTIVTSDDALESLKQALIEEYKALGMNQRQMTPEEAEADLKDWRNNKDTEEWIREQIGFLDEEMGMTGECDEDLDAFCTDPTNAELYAEEITILEEIDPEQVEAAIRLDTINKKAGKKPKNNKLSWLILEIRKYYKGHRNEDYRLIFDCMDLFGLIDDEVTKAWNKKDDKELKASKASYIKAVYKQALKYETDTQPTLIAREKSIGLEFHDTL